MSKAVQRVGVYVRVSTQDQSCELQSRELTEYARARGWEVVQVYEDKATGTNANRPLLKALIEDSRQRRIDVVLVWKLDRFARSLKDLVVMLQELGDLGVAFVSLRDNIDLSTATGRLMMHLLGAFAEFEASLIRERVRAGIRNAQAKGKRLGRPQKHDPAEIRRLRAQGLSYRAISKQMGVPMGTITQALLQGAHKSPSNG